MYRSWEERRNIIRSIIADSHTSPLTTFNLSKSEEVYFRARAAKMIDKLAQDTSAFKHYYALPTKWPFAYVLAAATAVLATAIFLGLYLYLYYRGDNKMYPLFGVCATLAVAAIGWVVAGWVSHRNLIRQNTNNMLFARFSHGPFNEALHRFNRTFADDKVITTDRIKALKATGKEEDLKDATSVSYLLNYYEFIASGVLHGDFDAEIVTANIRGVIKFFHDKCEPHIMNLNKENSKVFEHLIKVRTHYREP